MDIEEYSKFENLFLVELLDIYFDLNNYFEENAFDLLNSNSIYKSKEFIELIYNNTHTPIEDYDNSDEENNEFIYID